MTQHPVTMSGADRPRGANPVAAIAIHGALTAVGLVVALQAGLPLVGAVVLAWTGGAAATVALLLAQDTVFRGDALPVDGPDRIASATAPDL